MAPHAHAQKLYRWVDENGVVHYGDHIPPEYANRDRNVLNNQGVSVGFEEGERTETERADQAQQEAEAAAQQRAREEVARHDRMLLATYLTVEDIEELRDRRLELLESQIKVTELYVTNLRKRLVKLQAEAAGFTDSADNPRPVPRDLAREIDDTAGTIASYEEMLERTRSNQAKLRDSFAADIERFKELKGG